MIEAEILKKFSNELRSIYDKTEEDVDKANIKMTQDIFFLNLLIGYCKGVYSEFKDLKILLSNLYSSVITMGDDEYNLIEFLEFLKKENIKSSPEWRDGDETTDPEFAIRFIGRSSNLSKLLTGKNYKITIEQYFIISCIEYSNEESSQLYSLLRKFGIVDKLFIPKLKEIVFFCKEENLRDKIVDGSVIESYLCAAINRLAGVTSSDIITTEMFVNAGKTPINFSEHFVENSPTPYLDKYSENLINRDNKYQDLIDPVINRDRETQLLIEYISSRKMNSVILLGPSGSGKTAIIENLAKQINEGTINSSLKNTKIISISTSSLQAGATLRGMLSERLQKIINEVLLEKSTSNNRIILFFDNLVSLKSEGGIEIFNTLKSHISNGDLTIIGCATKKDYKLILEKNESLVGRFSTIDIKEPSREEAIEMVKAVIPNYSNFYKINYTDDIIEFAVDASIKYIHNKALPGKAIDLLNIAGSKVKSGTSSKDEKQLSKLKIQLKKVIAKKNKLVKKEEFDKANEKVAERLEIESQINELQEKINRDSTNWNSVEIQDIAEVIQDITTIPIDIIIEPDLTKVINLKSILKNKIIGQDEAIDELSMAVSKNFLGLRDKNKPIGSFIFAGASGIGKTLIAKQLARYVFGSEENMLRIDGGEYSMSNSIYNLIGYPGSSEQIAVFDKVRDNPYCVILIDEFEKMSPNIINEIFLNILDEGYVNLSNGLRVDFTNTIIIFTGNIGIKNYEEINLGFNKPSSIEEEKSIFRKSILDTIEKELRPEVRGRISKIIVFNNLTSNDYRNIIRLELSNFKEDSGKSIIIDSSIEDFIIKKIDNKFGVRSVKHLLETYVYDKICDEVISKKIKSYTNVEISLKTDTSNKQIYYFKFS